MHESAGRLGLSNEIELKLDVTPEAADFLEASALLEGKMAKAKLHARYFDTAQRDLQRNGLTLRIRSSGKKRVQTVKMDGGPAAGLFDRAEWELSVTDDTPVMDDRTPVPKLLDKCGDELSPAFEVKVERRTWMIAEGNASIELVIDRGAAEANVRTAPICEVELELKAGDANALFALARKLDAVAPVRLGVLSKSERGYLLLGSAPTAFKAEPVQLPPEISAAQAFQHIAQSCVRQFRLNEMLLSESRNSEALHQARVAIRRLRSALSIFKTLLADERLAHFSLEFKRLASVLGQARDIDVMMAKVPPGALQDRLGVLHGEAYTQVEATLASDRTRRLILEFIEWTGNGAWVHQDNDREIRDAPAAAFATATLRRVRKKVKGRGADFQGLSDDSRHDFRKLAKKLRYSAEFFGTLFPGKRHESDYRRFVKALEKLQDKLGLINDAVTAHAMLDKLGIADDPDAAALLHNGKRSKLLTGAADSYDKLLAAPKFWM